MGKHFGKYNAQTDISIPVMLETRKSAEMPCPLRLQWLFLDVPLPPPLHSGPPLLSVSLLLCRCVCVCGGGISRHLDLRAPANTVFSQLRDLLVFRGAPRPIPYQIHLKCDSIPSPNFHFKKEKKSNKFLCVANFMGSLGRQREFTSRPYGQLKGKFRHPLASPDTQRPACVSSFLSSFQLSAIPDSYNREV